MKLSVIKHGQAQGSYNYNGQEKAQWSFLVGRSDDCEIVLDDRKISREHAKFVCDKGNWEIKKVSDMGELVINGVCFEEKKLNQGDVISLGAYSINVEIDDTDKIGVQYNQKNEQVEVDELEEEINLKVSEKEIVEELENTNKKGNSYTADLETLNAIGKHSESDSDNDQNLDSKESLAEENREEEFSSSEDDFESLKNNDADFDNELMEQEDEYEMDDTGDGTQVAKSFSKFILEIFGESALYDKFILEDAKTIIGRDKEKCHIILNDTEVSSEHAVIKKKGGTYVLEDLKSANGTLLNGIRINQSELTNEDEFLIGSTTFTVKIISTFLEEQKERLMPVEENQVVEVEEVVEVVADFDDDQASSEEGIDFESDTGESKSIFVKLKKAWGDPAQRKKIIYGMLVLAVLLFMLPQEDTKKSKKKKVKQKKSYLLKEEKILASKNKKEVKLTVAQQESANALYYSAKALNDDGRYKETLQELDKLHQIISKWKNSKQIYAWAQGGLKRLEEEEKIKQAEIDRRIRKQKVKALVSQAQEAVKERHIGVAETLFAEIMKLEPENYDVTYMKATLEAWKKEQEKKRLAEEQKKADRARNIRLLKPGKQFYLKKKWHKAIVALEKFLSKSDMDDDLVKDAHTMLIDSRRNLTEIIEPLLGKARSLKEGNDLKGAYETYLQLLFLVPDNQEALKEMSEIRDVLLFRTRKIYREALISESLSLFSEAKEKFQEVQQISPSDSEYYRKATKRLKDYLE